MVTVPVGAIITGYATVRFLDSGAQKPLSCARSLWGQTVSLTSTCDRMPRHEALHRMTGVDGHKVYALPHDKLREVLKKYNRLAH
jgi:hypothetical protein